MVEMSSREIVRRCITFADPPRIAMSFTTMPIAGRVWSFDDFASVSYGPDPNFHPRRENESEWGYVMTTFDPTGENMGQPRENPLAGGWELYEHYRWPDFDHPARYADLDKQVAAAHAQGKYVYTHIPSLMLLASALRGMENWLLDHLLHPSELGELLDRITEIRLKIIDRAHRAGVDGVITWDDMGTNERGFVSAEVFRRIYFPRYKRAIDALHERGMHLLHHCCGSVREYMDMFVEAGLDVLQLDQPNLMGIDWLSEHYGGKLCFWNPVDIQTTAPTNDPERIADEAHHQVWAFGRFNGGFMVKAYYQPGSIGMTVEAAEAQYQAFMRYGRYPLIPYPQR